MLYAFYSYEIATSNPVEAQKLLMVKYTRGLNIFLYYIPGAKYTDWLMDSSLTVLISIKFRKMGWFSSIFLLWNNLFLNFLWKVLCFIYCSHINWRNMVKKCIYSDQSLLSEWRNFGIPFFISFFQWSTDL